MIAMQAAALVALVLGVVLVARAPALTVLRPVLRLPHTPRERVSLPTAAQIIRRPLAATSIGHSPNAS